MAAPFISVVALGYAIDFCRDNSFSTANFSRPHNKCKLISAKRGANPAKLVTNRVAQAKDVDTITSSSILNGWLKVT
jgi:hypothetical protein